MSKKEEGRADVRRRQKAQGKQRKSCVSYGTALLDTGIFRRDVIPKILEERDRVCSSELFNKRLC